MENLVDSNVLRTNERFKAIAGMCDNGALALFIAAVVKSFEQPDFFVVLDVAVGVVLMWVAWHVRGLLESEQW
jgi:hypothetical protein